jgi:hypothetical protein
MTTAATPAPPDVRTILFGLTAVTACGCGQRLKATRPLVEPFDVLAACQGCGKEYLFRWSPR